MTSSSGKVDRTFLFISVTLIVAGFFIFSSASLALLLKENSNYSNVVFSQTIFGLLLGVLAMIITSRVDLKFWRKMAFWILLAAIILNILVLIPGVGFEHAGAVRWLVVGPLSLQVSEALKFAFIIYFAAWAARAKDKIKTFRYGLLPLFILFSISGILLLSQPDTDNYLLIVLAGMAMLIIAGGKWRHLFLIMIISALALGALVMARPYLKQRFVTFFNPQADIQGASYQVRQSLIAVGSGGVFGRGFGLSVQKFTYLPEPIGDSVFAVAAEELGFVGSLLLIILFVLFAMRGLKIASHSQDIFARLTVVGIVIMIISQAFVNISAMLGMIPLSGITLPFVSHGGTSLFVTLFEVGIILSASRSRQDQA